MGTDGNRPEQPGDDSATAETLRGIFERFGLLSNESKTLVALVRLGSATAAQLPPLTGISRPNLYPVLESLASKQFINKVAGRRSLWVAPERDELILRLQRAEQQRALAAEIDLDQARAALVSLPAGAEAGAEIFRLTDEATGGMLYLQALGSARHHVLVWNRGPYPGEIDVPPELVDAVSRGVAARALWQADEVAASEAVRTTYERCSELGVDQRVVDALPHALAVLDGWLVLAAVPSDQPSDLAYPANILVTSKAFAASMTGAFEHYWATARSLAAAGVGVDGEADGGRPRRRRVHAGAKAEAKP